MSKIYAYVLHGIPCVPNVFKKASANSAGFPLARNLMQIGGFTLKKPNNDDGRYHIPSPHTKPAATADDNNSALCRFTLVQIINNIEPRAKSMVKVGPTRNGSAIAVIQGM